MTIISFQLGRRVEQITMIADMEGMGPHFLWRPGLDYTKAVSHRDEGWWGRGWGGKGREAEQESTSRAMIGDIEGMGLHFLWKTGLVYTKAESHKGGGG